MHVLPAVYTLTISKFLAGASPLSVASAEVLQAFSKDPRVDTGMSGTFTFPSDVIVSTRSHMRQPGFGPFGLIPHFPDIWVTVQCEGGSISMFNYVAPSVYHFITVKPKGGKVRTEKVYAVKDDKYGPGGKIEWWSTCVTLSFSLPSMLIIDLGIDTNLKPS